VARHDCIKKDYIIKEAPWCLILDAANIAYQNEFTFVFREETLYMVGIHRQGSIIPDVVIFALAVAIPYSLWLLFGAMAAG
jgi:hypothetical protein